MAAPLAEPGGPGALTRTLLYPPSNVAGTTRSRGSAHVERIVGIRTASCVTSTRRVRARAVTIVHLLTSSPTTTRRTRRTAAARGTILLNADARLHVLGAAPAAILATGPAARGVLTVADRVSAAAAVVAARVAATRRHVQVHRQSPTSRARAGRRRATRGSESSSRSGWDGPTARARPARRTRTPGALGRGGAAPRGRGPEAVARLRARGVEAQRDAPRPGRRPPGGGRHVARTRAPRRGRY